VVEDVLSCLHVWNYGKLNILLAFRGFGDDESEQNVDLSITHWLHSSVRKHDTFDYSRSLVWESESRMHWVCQQHCHSWGIQSVSRCVWHSTGTLSLRLWSLMMATPVKRQSTPGQDPLNGKDGGKAAILNCNLEPAHFWLIWLSVERHGWLVSRQGRQENSSIALQARQTYQRFKNKLT